MKDFKGLAGPRMQALQLDISKRLTEYCNKHRFSNRELSVDILGLSSSTANQAMKHPGTMSAHFIFLVAEKIPEMKSLKGEWLYAMALDHEVGGALTDADETLQAVERRAEQRSKLLELQGLLSELINKVE